MQETWVGSRVRNIPWRREWQPNSVFMPGKSHGQRSPAGYSPWGHREWDMTEQLNTQIILIRGRRKGWRTCLCAVPALFTLHRCVLVIIGETDGWPGFYVILRYSSHPEKAVAPHSGTLAWKIPWTEEPGGLQSTGS